MEKSKKIYLEYTNMADSTYEKYKHIEGKASMFDMVRFGDFVLNMSRYTFKDMHACAEFWAGKRIDKPIFERYLIETHRKKWRSQKVKCDACQHEWRAVHHLSTEKLECPQCGAFVEIDFFN